MTDRNNDNRAEGTGRSHRPGWFGEFGGQYVGEPLVARLQQVAAAYTGACQDPLFVSELAALFSHSVGRPSPLTFAPNLSRDVSGNVLEDVSVKVFLKREDLNHTGAHKINNCLGQALLAKRMGKTRLIAETGAGQHGVATATVAAQFGMECTVFMGKTDMERQQLNVFRMKILGAKVVPVTSGSATLKDALGEAMREWVATGDTTHYLIGSVAGPHPYPTMVRDFQSVIGKECRQQCLDRAGSLPDVVLACIGGGSNAAGIFAPFVEDSSVRLLGVEAAGDGLDTNRHSATMSLGVQGVFHGSKSLVLSSAEGQIQPAHSISAGLDYPGVGPEHAYWKATGRAEYIARTDDQALAGLLWLAKREGILCALESAHAVAAIAEAVEYTKANSNQGKEVVVVCCLSGRGDKDMPTLMRRISSHSSRDSDVDEAKHFACQEPQ